MIECEIEIGSDLVLDVTDPKGIGAKKFHIFRRELINNLAKKGINVLAENRKDFDGKVSNMLCQKDGYKLVRAFTYTYQQENRSYSIPSRVPNGIELCLRDISYVKNKKVV